MTTTADEVRNMAALRANQAASALAGILIEKCHGHDEYTKEYLSDLRLALNKLLEAEQLIRGER